MKKQLLTCFLSLFLWSSAFGQLIEGKGKLVGSIKMDKINGREISKRSASNPKQCGTDTSLFPNLSSTGYGSLIIGNGQSFGQFFSAPQEIKVTGFRFYAYFLYDTATKVTSTYVNAKIYEAGGDSLPTGSALASVSLKIDTISGNLSLNRLVRQVEFTNPVVTTKNYILVVECDSALRSRPAIVTNSWGNGDGEGRNIACASIAGKWYRSLVLNVGGVPFDCHVQYYPFVSYKFGTDFKTNSECFINLDTIRLNNSFKNNVSGSVFYNQYMYYDYAGFDELCHTWVYDKNNIDQYKVNGKFKPATKKNYEVSLQSRVVTFSGTAICEDTTTKIVHYKPANPSLVRAANGCIGDSLRIDVKQLTGISNNWYKSNLDPNPFLTANSYTINNLQKSDTFVLKATNGTCQSNFFQFIAIASQYPTTLNTKNDSICSGANANLTGSTNYGSLDWYTAPTGGTKVYTGNVYQTNNLNADTAFYLEANNNGCKFKSGRIRVLALVNSSFAPKLPTGYTDSTVVCYNGTGVNVPLRAKPDAGTTLRWFDVSQGGTELTTDTLWDALVLARGNYTYFVESWDGSCGSGRIAVNIIANQFPATFTRVSDEICAGDSADVIVSTLWGDVLWYSDKSASSHYEMGEFHRVGGLMNTSSYVYYKTQEGNCIRPNFDSVMVTVNSAPKPSSVNNNAVCLKTNGEMTVNITAGTVNWYEDENTPAILKSGKTIDLGPVFSDRTLYYTTENKGCKSKRTPLTVKALHRPAAGFTYILNYPLTLDVTPIFTKDMNIQWKWGDGNTSNGSTNIKHQYAAKGNYTVSMIASSTISSCKDTAEIPVIIDHLNVKNLTKIQMNAYPNPVKAGTGITISNFDNGKVQWYDLSGRFIGSTIVVNGSGIVPVNLTVGLYSVSTESNGQAFQTLIQITE